ncbi:MULTISPECIES: ABC1 kinase family protein [Paenibacillus]|uniref:ABC1 kinase family protein n=1 Tax=Paenibacillus TaxID=44249 RepID=UPI0022B90C70|nr:AarF/UbiB family protein [Paenibacillus caseinilyticus]MCZ8524114.1 AarF/UbiB family protein [Paenibacillus caseinilyticus]
MKSTSRYYRIGVITSMCIRFFYEIWKFERTKERLDDPEVGREALLRKQAREYRETALRLEGLLIKVGQFLSTRADLLPPAFTRELADLTDQVAPVPWEAARAVLASEWGGAPEDVLPTLSPQPIASASIAVVYRAELPDGRAVAVKVQRPGIRSVIEADFQAARLVMGMAKRFTGWGKSFDLDRLYRETVDIVSKELDFLQEAEHAKRFAESIQGDSRIRAPRIHEELTTRRVLVMEWVDARPITDASLYQVHGVDRGDVVRRLAASFLRQVVVDGFFHADPHPGNVRLQPDGTLVYLDFGMMGTISKEQRRYLLELVQSLVLQKYSVVVTVLEKLRFIRPGADREGLARSLATAMHLYLGKSYPSFDDEAVQDLLSDIRRFVSAESIQLPAEFAFMGRAASVVTGVIAMIEPDVDYLEIGQEVVAPLLQEGGEEEVGKAVWKPLAAEALDIARSLGELPRMLDSWMQLRVRREQQLLDERKYRLGRAHYERKQRAAGKVSGVLWATAILLYFFDSRLTGGTVAGLSLPFVAYHMYLERKLDRLYAGKSQNREDGNP